VSPGTELIQLVDPRELSLEYRVPEFYAAQLKPMQTVELSVHAFPERIFQGRTIFVSPVVDRKTYTIAVRAEIHNETRALWPGMSAQIRHSLTTYPEAWVLPETCLIVTLEGYEIYVVEAGHLVSRKITVGARQGGRVQIISGLDSAEIPVLLTRQEGMKVGDAVEAVDWQGAW
jgi:membrane fusion protein (multidrug efflux system)